MTPEELRALTEEGRAKKKEEARRYQEAQRQAEQQACQEMIAHVPEWIRMVEYGMTEAAEDGESKALVRVWREENWVRGRKLVPPALEKVVEHFTELGFEAKAVIDGETIYYSDGAGPGADNYLIEVKW